METDGAQPFTLELYDISGHELGINVSSATAITDTQLDAAISAGKARLIYKQNFVATPVTPVPPIGPARIMKGLAARAVGVSGTCAANLVVQGCYRYLNGTV
jgi:hypothetical protein